MKRKPFNEMNCSIARSLDEVGEWWSLLIVRECTQGTTRFDEFQSKLGIARNILTARLTRLTELDIIERFPLPDRANTDGYRLTKKGEGLFPVVVALKQWGDQWLCDGAPRIIMVDDVTGAPIEAMAVHTNTKRSLSITDVRYMPGPGATETTEATIKLRNERVLGKR